MPEPIIFHLGFPKTGTTTLQNRVFAELKGLHYIGRAKEEYQPKLYHQQTDFLHQLYLDLYFTKGNPEAYRKRLHEIAQKDPAASSYFISDEMLSSIFFMPLPLSTPVRQKTRSQTGKRALNDLFAELNRLFPRATFSLKIVYVVRNQSELFFSLFAENYGAFARQGERSLASFVDRTLRDPVRHTAFNYYELFTELQSVYGKENFLIYPFESLTQNPKAFFERLLDFTGARGNPESMAANFKSKSLNQRAKQMNVKIASPYRSTPIPYWAQDLRKNTKNIPGINKLVNQIVLPPIKDWHQKRRQKTFSIERSPSLDQKVRSFYRKSNLLFQKAYGETLPEDYF